LNDEEATFNDIYEETLCHRPGGTTTHWKIWLKFRTRWEKYHTIQPRWIFFTLEQFSSLLLWEELPPGL